MSKEIKQRVLDFFGLESEYVYFISKKETPNEAFIKKVSIYNININVALNLGSYGYYMTENKAKNELEKLKFDYKKNNGFTEQDIKIAKNLKLIGYNWIVWDRYHKVAFKSLPYRDNGNKWYSSDRKEYGKVVCGNHFNSIDKTDEKPTSIDYIIGK